MAMTALFMNLPSAFCCRLCLLRFDLDLVVDATIGSDHGYSRLLDLLPLRPRLYGPAKNDHAVIGADLDVLGVARKRIVADERLADPPGRIQVDRVVALIERRVRWILVTFVHLRVVGRWLIG